MKKRSSKNCTRKKKPREIYDFDLLPKVSAVAKCDDRISELPDDILGSIISNLTLREATATRILSSSWRHIDIMLNVVSLDFPYPLQQQEGYHVQFADGSKFPDYINWINRSLDSYNGGRVIKKFKIDLPCLDRDSFWGLLKNLEDKLYLYSEKWSEFAMSRETEIIDLRVIYCTKSTSPWDCPSPLYTFLNDNEIRRQSLSALGCLKELSLSGACLSNRDIWLLLSKFVVLERFSIESLHPFPSSKSDFHFGYPNSKLKHLSISNFAKIETISIYQMNNLVSLRCHGLETYDLYLSNVPNLVDVSIVNARRKRDVGIFPRIPHSICAQLLRVQLYIRLHHTTVNERTYERVKALTKLKHMELNVVIDDERSIQQLFPLIEACPSMEEVKIKFLWSCEPAYKHRRLDEDRVNRMAEIGNLKAVRMSGYVGSVFQLEFALNIINNAATLKELVLEAQDRNHAIRSRQIHRAFQHLLSVTPSHVDLILL